MDNAEAYNNLIIGYHEQHAGLLEGCRHRAVDSVQDERIDLRFWVRGKTEFPPATVVVAVFRQAGANAVEVAQSSAQI